MQISKLSLELSTVRYEEAERLYKAQTKTGFVDLARNLNQDDMINPRINVPLKFSDSANNAKISLQDQRKAPVRDHRQQSAKSQMVFDDEVQGHDQPAVESTSMQVPGQPSSVEEGPGTVFITHTNNQLDKCQELPQLGDHGQKGKTRVSRSNNASTVADDDDDKQQPLIEEGSGYQIIIPSATRTASPQTLEVESRPLSHSKADDERASYPLLHDDISMPASNLVPAHSSNPSRTNSEESMNSLGMNGTGYRNRSPALLPIASANNRLNVALEASNPEARHHNESRTTTEEILSVTNGTTPQVMHSERITKKSISVSKSAQSAQPPTDAQSLHIVESGFRDKKARVNPPVPGIYVDQTDSHSQSTRRARISWRPKFLKSKRERISGADEIIVQPSLVESSRLVP